MKQQKKVPIGTRPTAKDTPPTADGWVARGDDKGNERKIAEVDDTGKEPVKRLTLDIPASLHRTIKMQCAAQGTTIVDAVRALLVEKYGNQ